MGNSHSQRRRTRSTNDVNNLEPGMQDQKAPLTTTDSHTISDGLSVFHAGWRSSRRSRSPNPERTAGPWLASVMPPPPYTASGSRTPAATSGQIDEEDALELLRKYNVVFVVDDSTSMGYNSVHGTRWEEAGQALASIADVAAKYDMDGIDIHFLNNKVSKVHTGLKDAEAVRRLFSSLKLKSSTPIGGRLEELLLSYLDDLESAQAAGGRRAVSSIKPVNFITITDGHPNDPESVIVAAAKRLDEGKFPLCQVGIQFVQIGNSNSAKKYLQDLDDHLHSRQGIRDIVDTTPFTGRELDAESLVKILLGGINRRVDHDDSM